MVLVDRDTHIYTFVRVLMKYLEAKHPFLYIRAKAVVIDSAMMKKRQVVNKQKGNRKVAWQMVERLRSIVTEQQWNLANKYTYLFLSHKQVTPGPRKRRGARRPAPIPIVEP